MKTIRITAIVVGVVILSSMLGSLQQAQAIHDTFDVGDVFVSVGSSSVDRYTNAGVFVESYTCAAITSDFTTGSVQQTFGTADPDDDMLLLTMFDGGGVCQFDNTGAEIGAFGSGYSGSPESVFEAANTNVFVGAVDGDDDVREFDSAGGPVDTDDVATEFRGSDWITPESADVIRYTSEGTKVFRFDVSADAQLADFVDLSGQGDLSIHYANRVLSGGGMLVAGTEHIDRLDASGTIVQTYDALGEDCWFALNLDPNGEDFWSGDFCTNDVHRFNIASGADELSFDAGLDVTDIVFGLSVWGEIVVPPEVVVGGELLPIDMTSLFVVGAMTNAFWILPMLAGIAGAAFAVIRIRTQKIKE